MNPTEGALTFARPRSGDMLKIVLACDMLVVLFAVYSWELIDYLDEQFVIVAVYWSMIVLMAVGEIHCVTIDGQLVRVRNLPSMLRRRDFTVDEVVRIGYSAGAHGGLGQHLVVDLKPAPHRAWDSVRLCALDSTETGSRAGTPLFVAFMQAVSQVQPGIKVKKLPTRYSRMLPAPPAAAAAASTKKSTGARPGAGKTRKKERSKAKV